MSETETRYGKIKPVVIKETESLEDVCRRLIGDDTELPAYYATYVEFAYEVLEGKYVIINKTMYEILEITDASDEDIFQASRNPDGTINYMVLFYNGSCSFEEALEYAMENIVQ